MTDKKEIRVGECALISYPKRHLGFELKPGCIKLAHLSAEVRSLLGGGSGSINIIDLSDRMAEGSDTVTDTEIQNSIFVYRNYDRISGIARVVDPDTMERILLFRVALADNDNINHLWYFAYNTTDPVVNAATWHFKNILMEDSEDYTWAMSVFADAVVDVSNNTLNVGPNQFELTPVGVGQRYKYEYLKPVITEISWPVIPVEGTAANELVYPTVKFSQSIHVLVVDRENAVVSDSGYVTLTGEFAVNNGDMACTYSNDNYVSKAATISFSNAGAAPIYVTYDKENGGVSCPKSVKISKTEGSKSTVMLFKVYITVNGVQSAVTIAGPSQYDKYDAGSIIPFNPDNPDTPDVPDINPVNKITTNVESLAFTNKTIGETYTDSTLVVTGEGCKTAIAASITGDGDFTVSPSSISIGSASAGQALTITYKPTVESAIAYLKLTCGTGILKTTKTVVLTGSAAEAAAPTINANGITEYSFGNCYLNGSTDPVEFVITGANLTDDIIATIGNSEFEFVTSGTNKQMLTISRNDAMDSDGASFSIVFKPTKIPSIGSTVANLQLSSAGADNVVIKLKGNAVRSSLTVSKTSIDFSDVVVGETGTTQTFTVKGTNLLEDITIAMAEGSAEEFSVKPVTISRSSAAGIEPPTVTVMYKPTSAGTHSGTINVISGDITKTVVVSGTCKAATPVLTLSPSSLSFGNVYVNEASDDRSIVVKGSNLTSNVTASISDSRFVFVTETGSTSSNISINKDSIMTDEGKTVFVRFIPTSTGAVNNARITFTSTGMNSKTLNLSGTGVKPAINIADGIASLNFNKISVGAESTKDITVGGSNLKGDITLTYSGDSAFSLSNSTVTVTESTKGKKITVTFSPSEAGNCTGIITLGSSGADSKTISVSGVAEQTSVAVTGYYGATEALPTAPGDADGTFKVESGAVVELTKRASYVWIAVPSGAVADADVSSTDAEGDSANVYKDITSWDGYTIYYDWASGMYIDGETFKIK